VAIACKVPETLATLLKRYAEFLESTQEYVVVETLRLAFRRDKEFHAWLAATHPEVPIADLDTALRPAPASRPPDGIAAGPARLPAARRSPVPADRERP
jgi:hypothetical protein